MDADADASSDIQVDEESVSELRRTIAALRQENGALREASPSVKRAGSHRMRRWSSWVLVVLASLLAALSVLGVFVRNQLLNTDIYVSTVAPLAGNPAIQSEVASKVTSALIAKVDVQRQVKEVLPPKASILVAPITSGLTTLTDRIALDVVRSDAFRTAWVSINRTAHRQLVAVLTGSRQGAVTSSGGAVVLNLAEVQAQVVRALDAHGITVFNKVPTIKDDSIVLFQSAALVRAQRLTRLLNSLVYVLPVLAVLCYAGAILAAIDRRRGLVRAAAGLALTMGSVLGLLAFGENHYLSNLGPSRSRAANQALIDIVTGGLRGTVRSIFFASALVAAIALLAGNRWLRSFAHERNWQAWTPFVAVRRFVSEHRRVERWVVSGLGLILVVLWPGPTPLVVVIIVVVVAMLLALVALLSAPVPSVRSAPPSGGAGPKA
ncbi:MAG: hypothetical protein ACYCVN_04270 [Acidimicrobiales bacterium]